MEDSNFNLNLDGKKMLMNGNITIQVLLDRLGIHYEDVLVIDVKNTRLLTSDNRIYRGDSIEIRTVYSKG